MASSGNSFTPENSAERNGWVDRLFIHVEKFALSHAWSVLAFSVLLAVAAFWFTKNFLKFNTHRGDLVSQDLHYNQLYQKYREEFEDFDGILIVVEGHNHEQMKNFTETIVDKLKKRGDGFSRIFYKIDTEYFRKKALLYLDPEQLKDVLGKMKSRQAFLDDVNAAPGLNQLLRSINAQISSGMVAALLTDFMGGETENPEKDDSADLKLLIAILKQMTTQLNGETAYRSPWESFLSDRGDSLKNEGYLTSEDESMLFILLNPEETKGDFNASGNAIQTIRELIKALHPRYPDIKVGLTGGDVIASDEMAATKDDVALSSQISLAGVALIFIVFFRGVVKPLLAILSLAVSICWVMGFATLTIGHLNILSVAFTPILIGLGIDFGIHIIERYREERSAGQDIATAFQRTIHGTGKGNFAGALTTAMAFGAMTLTDFKGIAELGWIAGSGIIFCLVGMVLLLPALITLEEKWRGNGSGKPGTAPTANGRLDRFFDHYAVIIGVSVALVAAGAFSLKNASFDYNILNLQAKGTEAVQYELKIIESAKRSTWYAASIAVSLEDAKKKHNALKAIPSVGKVESIASVLPERQEEKIAIIKSYAPFFSALEIAGADEPFSIKALVGTMKRVLFKMRGRGENSNGGEKTSPKQGSVEEAHYWVQKFLDDAEQIDPQAANERLSAYSKKLFVDYRELIDNLRAQVSPSPISIDDLPPDLRKKFIGKTGKYLVSVFPNINIWEREAMETFLHDIREIDPDVTGNAVHVFESSRMMREGYIKGGIYASTAIVLYLILSFGSVRTAFIILIPKLVGAVWMVGIMDLLEVRFNLANLVILPLILGVGVANGIHIIHRYREESDKTVTVLSKSTGQAVFISSLTTITGFGSLMVADHQGIHSLGLVLTIGMSACLIASMTLLPAILKLCTVKGWKV